MKDWYWMLVLVLFLTITGVTLRHGNIQKGEQVETPTPSVHQLSPSLPTKANPANSEIPKVSVVASGLDVPWAIAFLPDGGLLVTEKKGTVRLVTNDGTLQEAPVATIPGAREIGEGGLLGIAIHPNFEANNYVYLYYTYREERGHTFNRVVRSIYNGSSLTDEAILVDAIPGAVYHDGGRIKFGPDGFLYITTGDAQNPSLAQNTNALAGKTLRITDEGKPAPGNPFNNQVYSYGHRNPQGITWDQNGTLWETEHGPSGTETGNDEFNRIEAGKNYGWPDIRGMQTKEGMVTPIVESGRSDTWAPSGLAFLNGSFYFAGLKGQALYKVTVTGNTGNLQTFFKNDYGRLREVVVGPDGMLYVTTSNRDGRGNPSSEDDKILRINPNKL